MQWVYFIFLLVQNNFMGDLFPSSISIFYFSPDALRSRVESPQTLIVISSLHQVICRKKEIEFEHEKPPSSSTSPSSANGFVASSSCFSTSMLKHTPEENINKNVLSSTTPAALSLPPPPPPPSSAASQTLGFFLPSPSSRGNLVDGNCYRGSFPSRMKALSATGTSCGAPMAAHQIQEFLKKLPSEQYDVRAHVFRSDLNFLLLYRSVLKNMNFRELTPASKMENPSRHKNIHSQLIYE